MIASALSRYSDAVLNFIYPRYCLVCKSGQQPGANLICATCWQRLPRLGSLANKDVKNANFNRFLCIWSFNEFVQRLIHEIKFFGKKSLAILVGNELAKIVTEDKEFSEADCIIPVPLHKTKLRERGFNQSLLLSEQISERSHIPVNKKILRRIRYTRPQSKLTATEREHNVRGAFKVKSAENFAAKTVILVDDVLTTGSTMRECADALKRAGVQKVFALTAAATLIDSV